jgi:hypothetical protein
MENTSSIEPGMASSATYQITTKGKLAEGWADWFNGAIIRIEYSTMGNPHTVLTCHIKDQSHLLGILNRLNSLNLPLLEVILTQEK